MLGQRIFGTRRKSALFCTVILLVSAAPAFAVNLKVLVPGAYKAALDEIVPQYERESGHKLVVQYNPAAVIAQKIEAGEEFDVAITSPTALDGFAKRGVILTSPIEIVGINTVLLAYKPGSQKPDISTPDALKAVLLKANRISYSDPAAGGGSSNYFMGLIQQLGISDEVKKKAIITKPAEGTFPVGDGRADLAVSQTSEVAMVSGVEAVPLNPSDPKSSSSYAAGISSKSKEGEASRALIAFMLSPNSLAIRKAKGLAPK
jgi:molybdate transport system substrate-binding protein